jgi:putative colanic acid biosysnthesis UDP-glucose lipid carrier transferase
MVIRSQSRPILQRRKGLVNLLQPILDGLAIIATAWFFVIHNIGYLTQDYIILMLVMLGLVSVIYDRYAIYRTSSNFSTKMFNLFNAWTISFLALFLLGFLTKQSHVYSRAFILELYVFGFLAQATIHMALRALTKQLNKHSHVADNVIIVGQGQLANYLEHKITANPWLNQHVIGNVSIEEEELTLNKTQQKSELNEYATSRTIQLGKVAELPSLIDTHGITTIYIVTPLESSKVLEELYFVLLDKHVSIHWIPDIFSLRLINHSVREIAGIPVLTLSETPLTGVSRLAKSIEDVTLSFLILLLLSPVLLVVAVAIKYDSSGPVFFRQKRAGWNGKTFRIWKFRSMYVHKQSDKETLKQAEKNDPRVTKVGAFIRKTSLDELPQLFNVLTGDMSLVGPRPHAVQHDEEYSEGIDDYYARHNIKPGITGLAQVRGYRGETKEIDQMTKRIESDIEYINNWSIWLDLSILLRTTKAFTGKSAY